MLVQAYGAAIAIIVCSVVLGKAVCALCGGSQRWWAAPAVGYATLIAVTTFAVKLPGTGVTSAIVCGLLVLASVVYLLRRGGLRFPLGDLVVGGAALLGASIPFVANGRVALPGATWDNDLAVHLLVSETLRSSRMERVWGIRTPGGYPLGPHSLVATLGTAADLPLDMVFTGLLMATVVITALVAADVVAKEAMWRRAIVGVLCALTYLAAAYYGEGSFKEPIVAGLLLAFVLHLEQVRARWSQAGPAARCGLVIPAGLLVLGAVNTFSYFGVAWFGATVAVWAVAEAAYRPSQLRGWISVRRLRAAAPWVAGMIVLGVILLLPILGQFETVASIVGASPASTLSFASNNLGNLPGPLSAYEALGLWTFQDFRYVTVTFHQGELCALGLGALGFGFLWSLSRRQLVMPAAVAASAVIYWYVERTQSPYVAAKALVIAAPVVMALGLRALLSRREGDPWGNAVALVVAALVCFFAAESSYLTLHTEPVQAPETARELTALHHRTGDAPILFLGVDDFASWDLRDSPVDSPASSISVSVGGVVPLEGKYSGGALNFESIAPVELDIFPWVITTNTPYAGQAPANFRLIARERLYELWKRTGPTAPFSALAPPGQPGAILDCQTRLGRKLHASRGVANVMATPVVSPGASLEAGETQPITLRLPKGRWELSAQYISFFNLDFRAEGQHWTMPAYLGRNGPWFAVGAVTGRGVNSPVTLKTTVQRPSLLTGLRVTAVSIYSIAATRIPDTRTIVPLKDACGKYVDWYRL